MKPEELEALTRVSDYLWDDEETDYLRTAKPKDHIFLPLQTLALWRDSEPEAQSGD